MPGRLRHRPVMMCNEAFHEGVTQAKAEEILKQCQ